jgi:hypothetical protein
VYDTTWKDLILIKYAVIRKLFASEYQPLRIRTRSLYVLDTIFEFPYCVGRSYIYGSLPTSQRLDDNIKRCRILLKKASRALPTVSPACLVIRSEMATYV